MELSKILSIFARRSVRNSAAPQQLERAPLRSACTSFAGRKNINMEENDVMIAAEPAAALLSEEVRRSGILSQVMKLSQPDKVALIAYLRKDTETEEPFKTDEFGRIKLTKEMRDAAMKAEREYEDGKCLTEADFKERFAKWL